MVRRIIEGWKIQTRRVVNITHKTPGLAACLMPPAGLSARPGLAAELCPYGQPGDRLWVRETWQTDKSLDDKAPSSFSAWPVRYKADGAVLQHGAFFGSTDGKTRVSIHMPRWASRIILEITAVRVEKLHDISEADAEAECPPQNFKSWRDNFCALWQQINGDGAWDANPWVWVIEFKRIEQ